MLRKVGERVVAFGRAFRKSGSSLVIRVSRAQSSIRVRRISSVIVSTRIVSSIIFRPRQSRPSGGGQCAGGGGCIACDGNEEEECVSTCSHAADERCEMAERRTSLVWSGWRKRVLKSSKSRCVTCLKPIA